MKKRKNFKKVSNTNEAKRFKAMNSNSRPLGKATNSPNWYYPSPEIQKMAAAVSFNNRNGNSIDYADGVNLNKVSNAVNIMPGVAANQVWHVPGKANQPNDPLNEATRAIMDNIRKNINATRNYEMPDLGKYLLSVADLFAWVEFLKTVYRTVRKYNVLNAYTPTVLLRAMNIDTSDINNLGIQLKFYINTLVYRIKNLRVPLDIPILPTWIEDFKHVWMDEDIAKAQYIVNKPKYILKYTIGEDSKSHVVPKIYSTVSHANTPYTVDDLIDFTEDLLSELINDEDFAIITGDIMKTYSSFYELSEVGDDIIEFEYSKEFLEKWHNACMFPDVEPDSSLMSGFELTEATSPSLDPYLVFDPVITASNENQFNSLLRGAGNRMLDFYDREISSDQIINGALWMWSFDVRDRENLKIGFATMNTSFIGSVELWFFDRENHLTFFRYQGVLHLNRDANSREVSVYANLHWTLVVLTKWNYYPFTVLMLDNNAVTSSDIGFLGLMGDLGNYTIVDKRILKNISTCIMYGQYNINYLLGQ